MERVAGFLVAGGPSFEFGDRFGHRLVVDVGVGVDRGAHVRVPKQLLRDSNPGRRHDPGGDGVAEHVGRDRDAGPGSQSTQGSLERAVGQGLGPASPQPHPRRVVRRVPTLLGEIGVEGLPERVRDRHAVLIPRALQQHDHRGAAPVQIGQAKTEDPVPTVLGTPIADPLSGLGQQGQDRLVPPRPGPAEQRVDLVVTEDLRHLPRLPSPQLGTRTSWWCRAATTHPVSEFDGHRGHRVGPTSPPATPVAVAFDEETEEGREHAQTMVHRPSGAGLTAAIDTTREPVDVGLDVRLRNHVEVGARVCEPLAEISKTQPIGPGRVAAPAAPLQVADELPNSLIPTTRHRRTPLPDPKPSTVITPPKLENLREDIRQTDGPPLPDPGIGQPTLLTGQAPVGLWDRLQGFLEDRGFEVRRGACHDGANGYTDFTQRLVMVRDDVDDAQSVKTLAHEGAHSILHADRSGLDCRGILEVEAESVAYMVTSAHGLDSSQYTFNYVAGWALNAVTEERDLADVLRSTGQRVIGAADLILQATLPAPSVTDIALDALETDLRIQTDPTRWEAAVDSVAPAVEPAPGCTAVVAPALTF